MAIHEVGIEKKKELESLTLAFVVRNQGLWSDSALIKFCDYLNSKMLIQNKDEFEELLERTRVSFHEAGGHLYVCQGNACQKRQRFDISPETLNKIAVERACAVTLTSCQGHCGAGPVATLHAGDRCEMFSQFENENDWQIVLNHAEASLSPEAKNSDTGVVEVFRFDPVEGQRRPRLALQKFRFLIGRYKGEGKQRFGTGTFFREIEGSWESSGRFVQLRVALTIKNDGIEHTYHSIFMIGAIADGRIQIWNFTSVGDVDVSQLIEDGDRFYFDEKAAPNSGVKTRRTVWIPNEEGYEQLSEVDEGEGEFKMVSTMAMRRDGTH